MRWCSSALYTATSASSRPPSRRRQMVAACRASGAGPPRGASPPALITFVVDRVPVEHFLLDVCGHVSELCWFVGRKDIESALFEQSNTIFHNISLSPRVARAANCQHRHIFHSLSARAAAARSSTTMMMRSTEVVAGAQHRRSGRVVARRERRKTAAIGLTPHRVASSLLGQLTANLWRISKGVPGDPPVGMPAPGRAPSLPSNSRHSICRGGPRPVLRCSGAHGAAPREGIFSPRRRRV